MNSKAYLSVVTFPLVTSAVLLAYACATQGPATEASLPVAQTVIVTKPAKPHKAKTPLAAAAQQTSDATLVDEPAASLADAAPVAAKDKPKAAQAEGRKSGRKVTRYVAVESLNVRSKPQLDAEVVAKLARGSMLPVVISGAWARIGDSQWIQVRYLSDRKPGAAKAKRRFVSRR
jgi:uncharacterized protein YgiM (DUF1202 family)